MSAPTTGATPATAELPRISLVTPSFNQAEFLEATLRSVLDQGYPNLEYIVVDGGSTDGSTAILERYADRLAWWVSEPDRGHGHALNKGFARATGEILGWINSDDLLLPGASSSAGSSRSFRTWSG
jgi:glycosyltransferase involved in cell wall biosynthesis